MALAASPRRDQRRRLLTAWTRSANQSVVQSATRGDDAKPAAAYDEAARPERHPALATRLPTGLGGLALAAAAIILPMAVAIAAAVAGPLFGLSLPAIGGRFARSGAAAVAILERSGPLPLHAWLAELNLLAAAAVAGAVRYMRRHRRDDYRGRFRAWGWLSLAFTVAAWAGAVPLGPLFAAILTDSSGIAFGPGGIGWWVGFAACCLGIVVPWAVLPLRERLGTGFWMIALMGAWAAAAAMPWAAAWVGGEARGAVIAAACWAGGSAAALVGMLTAARSVIREVRGESPAVKERPARRGRSEERPGSQREAVEEAHLEAADEDDDDDRSVEGDADDDAATDYIDGSQRDNRRLSKAEKKRLRKLARMNGDAA